MHKYQKASKLAFCEHSLIQASKRMAVILSRSGSIDEEYMGSETDLMSDLKKLIFSNRSAVGRMFGRGELEKRQQLIKELATNKAIEHVTCFHQFPSYMKNAGTLFKAHSYLRKGLFTNLLTSLSYANQQNIDENRLADLCACIEMMSTGFYLMENLERREELLSRIRMSSLIADKFSKKNLILSSDLLYAAA